jgi:phosphoribosylformylglycinamidine synthase
MNSAVIVFPGINRERDMMMALEMVTGKKPISVWHTETALPSNIGLAVIPGGFSYGDYLRCGAIAARSPNKTDKRAHAL